MAKQRAFANKEREFQAQRLSRMGRALLLSLATVLSFAALGLLVADQIYRPNTFVISQLKIVGKFRHLDPVDVEAALADQDLGNFFSVELAAVKEKVETLPWVQQVDVRREWPNTLELMVTEQRPVMRWGKDKWVSAVGEVISLPESVKSERAIVLYGEEQDALHMLRKASIWKKQLRGNGLELRSLRLSGSRAWTLSLFDPAQQASFDLLLGRDNVAERLSRFQYLFEKQFRAVDKRLQRVDARYPDGLAVMAEEVKPDDAVAANQDFRG